MATSRKSAIVLGGGISGMAISRCLSAKYGFDVTCLEQADRFGGWISSKRSATSGVLLEQGPHSLRPRSKGNGLRVVQLLQELGLENEALCSQGSERFVWAKSKLTKLPSDLSGVFTNPLTRKLPPRVVLEALSLPAATQPDMTIGQFIEGRFGKDMKLLVSAMVAGVFAGNVDKLSVKSCFPDLVRMVDHGKGSLVRGMLLPSKQVSPARSQEPQQPLSPLVKASGITFKDGMGHFAQKMEAASRAAGVHMHSNSEAIKLSKSADTNKWTVVCSNTESTRPFEADYVFSTLSPSRLFSILENKARYAELEQLISAIGKVDVAVVNLAYDGQDVHLPPRGFGHLVAEPEVQLESGCIGVIYDSNAFPQQQPNGVSVVSVMLGGANAPWVANLNEREWINLARKAMLTHLHVGVKPLEESAVLHRNCIPQYRVGHSEAARAAKIKLEQDDLFLFGTGVLGAGIADSVGGALLDIENKF